MNKPRAPRRLRSAFALGHWRAARAAVGQLRANPTTSVIGMAVMAIALALPATLYALIEQQRALFTHWGAEPTVTVFTTHGTALDAVTGLATSLRTRPDIGTVDVIPADQAYSEFAASVGLDAQAFGAHNPLPHVLVVTPRAQAWHDGEAAALVDELRALDAVDSALVDLAWVERLNALTALARRALMVLATMLLSGTALVIGNTIRIAVQEHALEIEVLKLVGATDAYVRRPFLYSGAAQGFAAGCAAALLVEAVLVALAAPVEAVARAYLSAFSLDGIGVAPTVALIAVATLVGWCGAWLGTMHSLARLDSAPT